MDDETLIVRLYNRSGPCGVSGISGDMRTTLAGLQ